MSRTRTPAGWVDEGHRPSQPNGVGWPLGMWSGIVAGDVAERLFAPGDNSVGRWVGGSGAHIAATEPVNWFKQYHRVRR